MKIVVLVTGQKNSEGRCCVEYDTTIGVEAISLPEDESFASLIVDSVMNAVE